MADLIVSEGYSAAGYEYINVDDCWLEKQRNSYGQLVPDRQRFPRGMKSLADYVGDKKKLLLHHVLKYYHRSYRFIRKD